MAKAKAASSTKQTFGKRFGKIGIVEQSNERFDY